MLYIPEKLKVGFQNRNDTYTKKLAYVTCYNEKNKLRQELSWNGWRDIEIEPEEFTNTPIEGFVLNKKVGDYNSRWGGRRAYVRIYDPRGFEFEISVDNLIFILEKNSSIVGKGLEGSYVYSWDKNNIVLLPTNSEEYIESKKYSNIIHKNITVTTKTIKVGNIYKNRNGDNLVYLGKHKIYEDLYFENLYGNSSFTDIKRKYVTNHVFSYKPKNVDYIIYKFYKSIPTNIFDENLSMDKMEYDEYHTDFMNNYSVNLSYIDPTRTKIIEIDNIFEVLNTIKDKSKNKYDYYSYFDIPQIDRFIINKEHEYICISFNRTRNEMSYYGYTIDVYINGIQYHSLNNTVS